MIFRSFPLRLFTLYMLRTALLCLISGLGAAAFHSFVPKISFAVPQILPIAGAAVTFYLFLRCMSRRYSIKNGRIYYSRGVIFKRSSVIGLKSLTLFAQIESPLARLLRLSGAALWGGRLLIYIEGLNRAQMLALRAALEQAA